MTDMLSLLADLQKPGSAAPAATRTKPGRSPRVGLEGRALDLRAMVRRAVVTRLHAALRARPCEKVEPAEILVRDRSRPVGRTARDEVVALADHMLADDLEGACGRMAVLRAGGQTLESIFLHVLAPTACHLRDLWSKDLCGLADVTLALCNLRTLLRRHAAAFGADGPETGRRALIVSAAPAGDIDVGLPLFDLTLTAQFFRRGGWQPRIECGLAHPAVRDAVRGEWFDLAAILIPDGEPMGSERLDAIATGIRAIRRNAPNATLGVVVHGAAFVRSPELLARVGADHAARDPIAGLALAGQLARGASALRRRQRLS